MSNQRDDLLTVYKYIVELQMARMQAEHPNNEHVQEQPLHHDMLNILKDWYPMNPWPFPGQLPEHNLKHCSWGWQTACALLDFIKTCRWPIDDEAPQGQQVGISWIEMAFGLALTLGTWIPIKRRNKDGEPRLIWIRNHHDAVAHHVTVAEQSEGTARLLRQVQALLGYPIIPSGKQGKVRSLYILGESFMGHGILCRPYFPHQRVMMDMVTESQAHSRKLPRLENTVEQWECDRHLSSTSFTKLSAGVTKLVKSVKQMVTQESALVTDQ